MYVIVLKVCVSAETSQNRRKGVFQQNRPGVILEDSLIQFVRDSALDPTIGSEFTVCTNQREETI